MRRRIAGFLSAALVAGVFSVLAPAQPAGAVVVCAGAGTANVNPGLLYPPFGSVSTSGTSVTVTVGNTNSAFAFNLNLAGGCLHPPSTTLGNANAAGVVSGWCGLSSGRGTVNGELFAWVGVGSLLVLTGHVVGAAVAVPDVPGGQSCSPTGPGASVFDVAGAAVSPNCNTLLDTQALTPPITQQTLTTVGPVSVHVGVNLQLHVWVNHPCTDPDPVL